MSRAPSRRALVLGLGIGVALSGSAACGGEMVRPAGPQESRPPVVAVTRTGPPANPTLLLVPATGRAVAQQRGHAEVIVGTLSMHGGEVRTTHDAIPGTGAFDFPAFRTTAHYPRAVVAVAPAGDEDLLEPRTVDFMWGAEFVLDERSAGPAVDNGDNVVQRGLFGHPAFFKAELDLRRAGCTVTGDRGTLVVRARELVRPGWHYTMRCKRSGDDLSVSVTETRPDGGVRTYASHTTGPIGDVDFAGPSVLLTVGGKTGVDGEIIGKETDQFNGVIANPYLAIDP